MIFASYVSFVIILYSSISYCSPVHTWRYLHPVPAHPGRILLEGYPGCELGIRSTYTALLCTLYSLLSTLYSVFLLYTRYLLCTSMFVVESTHVSSPTSSTSRHEVGPHQVASCVHCAPAAGSLHTSCVLCKHRCKHEPHTITAPSCVQ